MKVALGLLIAFQLVTSPFAMADTVVYDTHEKEVSYSEDVEPTRQEQFKWYYRMHEGHQQKRLWSLTYGYWVTDWIDC